MRVSQREAMPSEQKRTPWPSLVDLTCMTSSANVRHCRTLAFKSRRHSSLLAPVNDARTTPAYPLHEAARILRVPASTLRTWFPGRRPAAEAGYFNFLELAQAYAIQVLRSKHQLPMRRITKAIGFLKKKTGEEYPLAMTELGFQTDGVQLFVDELGRLVSASENGQVAMRTVLEKFLERVDYDNAGIALRFFPFTRDYRLDSPKFIVIDPTLNFGRPCLADRGIATAMIARRYKAGESIPELAEDYGCDSAQIDEAIRTELELASSLAA